MATILVIVFSGGSERGTDAQPVARAVGVDVDLSNPRSVQCPSARKAVRFYQRQHAKWRAKMGVGRTRHADTDACPRYLARVWKAKAAGSRAAYHRWHAYHFEWWKWLPDKWQRIGACETGYGRRPGQWTWNSGTYQGAFGFYHGTWDQYKPRGAPSEAYLATPRQQYQCALNVAAVHGYGAWGCGGA